MKANIKLGKKGEEIAEKFLAEKGAEILARNYKFDRAEIDLIVMLNNELVFVEVKTRRSDKFGFPENAVNEKKLNQIRKAAENFIEENSENLRFDAVRIDVIAISVSKHEFEIEHFENVAL